MASPVTENEPEQLARFREEWKREVEHRKLNTTSITTQTGTSTSTAPATGIDDVLDHRISIKERSPSPVARMKRRHPRGSSISISNTTELDIARLAISEGLPEGPKANATAIALDQYRQAVEAEQQGHFDHAVNLYRASFKRDPHIDKVYQRSLGASAEAHSRKAIALAQHTEPITAHVTDNLRQLFSELDPHKLTFVPEDEKLGVPLDQIPDELIVHILRELANIKDVVSIERFGVICRKARIVSLDGAIWRHLVGLTYVGPQVAEDLPLDQLSSRYGSDYRSMYISHPRVRMDGVYISVCNCQRPGYNENPWATVSHLVTYHRYLRFMHDGTALSLLANDEVPPAQVIRQLKPSLKMKGFYVGRWQLEGTTVLIEDLLDSEGIFTRYSFEMTLELQSRPVGRWNRLSITEYNSINLSTDESQPLALKHERPFWFSKVRSFVP
ncbi:hypothetical protein FRB94_010132 [Tulasnella sp. JGI-2019a]|nr:hypothetical protein FRB94_010132 [Tulasnella sp. JGI-2019a]KAG9018379.1 hypothetical protein FRB93_000082 [Tulasnella sp. JGI-2019a]